MAMMTPVRKQRKTDKKEEDARQHAVVNLYNMMYSQSQLCNWLQRAFATFLNYHGLSDIGLRGAHRMGLAIGMTSFYKDMHDYNKSPQLHQQNCS